jgi:conjugative transfer pilus assembly protein TraH
MNLQPSLAKRVCAAVLILSLQAGGAAHAADLSAQMANMFGSGVLSNVTGPGAYQSQTQNIYTGGELQLRMPTRNYQFWSYSLPSIAAGCGGVDAYLGSFSHIKSDQFKAVLEQVAKQYAALLFKAALKSINPLIESVIGDLQKSLESVNQANGNTCAMARSLLDATSTTTGMTSETSCVAMAMKVWDEDEASAKVRCKSTQAPTNAAAQASADPAIKALADKDMNLVWEALRGSSFTTEEKTVFMNIAGTILIFKPANNGDAPKTPQEHAAAIDSLSVLLNGNEPAVTPDQVRITNWLACNDDQCMSPTRSTVSITPFTTQVRLMMEGIRDAVVNRIPLTATQIRFINMTRVPVYRMLSAGYTGDSSSRREAHIDLLITRYSKVIAYDYAYAYLRTSLKDVRTYLGMARLTNAVEEKQSARLISNVDALMKEIEVEHQKAQGQVRDANAVIDDLQRTEREMRANLPGSIRGMLDMSTLLRGAGGR